MQRTLFLCAGILMLAGCTTVNRAMEYDAKVNQIQTEDGLFRVFEHPTENSLMTSPSLGAALGGGVVQGATFGIVDSTPEEQKHEKAARIHLNNTGRENCTITSGYLLAKPQYEFSFSCVNPE